MILCKNCTVYFEPKRSNQLYCCRTCLKKSIANKYYNKNKEKCKQRYSVWRKNNLDYVQIKRKESSKKEIENGEATYSGIKTRCNNRNHKDYKYYGAKNIKCLLSKKQFLEIFWYSDQCIICNCLFNDTDRSKSKNARTIDRINSDGNYEINNVRIICKSCNSNSRRINDSI